MIFHLTDGTARKIRLGSNMLGYAITGVTLDRTDVRALQGLTDVQMFDFLNHLGTRFAPAPPKYEEHQLAPFATPRSTT